MREMTGVRLILLAVLCCSGVLGCTGKVSGLGASFGDQPPIPGGQGAGTNGSGGPVNPDGNDEKPCAPIDARIWLLTPTQYQNTLQSAVANAPVPSVAQLQNNTTVLGGVFSNQAAAQPLSEPYVAELFQVATAWASGVADKPQQLGACAAQPIDGPCLQKILEPLTRKAFRRAATADELAGFDTLFSQQKALFGQTKALELILTALAMSPDVLFRTELGDSTKALSPLSGDELASALSYTLADVPPDAELTAAASAGALTSKAEVQAQARRLLKTQASGVGARRFLHEQMELKKTRSLQKDTKVYSVWNATLASEVEAQTAAFLDYVVWQGAGTTSELLTSQVGFVNEATAPLVGLQASGSTWMKVAFPAERRGILTMPAVLATHAQTDRSSLVFRGKFIMEALLCTKLQPPLKVPPLPAPMPGLNTQRQRISMLTAESGCQTCHRAMNNMGFAFEHFDGIGRYRSDEAGEPIDASGLIVTDTDIAVSSATDFAQKLSFVDQVSACMAQQALAYTTGRIEEKQRNSCAEKRLLQSLKKNGGDLRELLVEAVSDESFLMRSAP